MFKKFNSFNKCQQGGYIINNPKNKFLYSDYSNITPNEVRTLNAVSPIIDNGNEYTDDSLIPNRNTLTTTEILPTLISTKGGTTTNKLDDLFNNYEKDSTNFLDNPYNEHINGDLYNKPKRGNNLNEKLLKSNMANKYQQGGQATGLLLLLAAMVLIIKQVAGQLSGQEISDDEAVKVLQNIYQKALSGDLQAAKLFGEIQQAAQQMLLGAYALKAAHGAKLLYIKNLLKLCPNGYEMTYFKAGGRMCSKCTKKKDSHLPSEMKGKKHQVEQACSGTSVVRALKAKMKCGAKLKKAKDGNTLTPEMKKAVTTIERLKLLFTDEVGMNRKPKDIPTPKGHRPILGKELKLLKNNSSKLDKADTEKCGGKLKKKK